MCGPMERPEERGTRTFEQKRRHRERFGVEQKGRAEQPSPLPWYDEAYWAAMGEMAKEEGGSVAFEQRGRYKEAFQFRSDTDLMAEILALRDRRIADKWAIEYWEKRALEAEETTVVIYLLWVITLAVVVVARVVGFL